MKQRSRPQCEAGYVDGEAWHRCTRNSVRTVNGKRVCRACDPLKDSGLRRYIIEAAWFPVSRLYIPRAVELVVREMYERDGYLITSTQTPALGFRNRVPISRTYPTEAEAWRAYVKDAQRMVDHYRHKLDVEEYLLEYAQERLEEAENG